VATDVFDDVDRALAAGAPTWPASTTGVTAISGRFESERPIVFEHYLTLFGRALGIEFEDTYKKYMQWATRRGSRGHDPAWPPTASTPMRRAGSSSDLFRQA